MRTFPHESLVLESFDTEFKARSAAVGAGRYSSIVLDEEAQRIRQCLISFHFNHPGHISNEVTG